MEIGHKLYKSAPPLILEYEVIGVRNYHDNTQYELRCLSCRHGTHCEILVGGKSEELVFIQVLNDDEDEPQHYWHSDQTGFHKSPNQARIERFRHHIRHYKDDVERSEILLAQKKKNLAEQESVLAALEKEPK